MMKATSSWGIKKAKIIEWSAASLRKDFYTEKAFRIILKGFFGGWRTLF
jgi:hypothetical protein